MMAPVVAEMREIAARPPACCHAAAGDAGALRVLVADDDASVRRLVARALRRHGCEVTVAADGRSALELADADPPDLAIVDLHMPGARGDEVVHHLKQAHGIALPCIVLSGMDAREDRVGAFEAGADDFVAKPVDVVELVKRVDAFDRSRRAYEEVRLANERADRLRLFAAEAAALLAHDLNNGLSIATANLQYIGDFVDMEGDFADAMAGTMRALRRMTGLVRNFVDIARLEDAALEATRAPVDVRELLDTAALIHEPQVGPGDKVIRVDCDEGIVADIDPVLVERVIHNLLNNATRYVTPGGRIGLRGALVPSAGGGAELVLQVGNSGNPIPPAIREGLFGKYRKGNDGKAQRGMGLYFCRLACNAHGGSIAVIDHDEFPACFEIRLPCDPRTAQAGDGASARM